MNYDYYRVFLAVGKHRSLTKAAEELYTSQPAVSRTIKNLESELGVALFSRSKKGVEFTLEGQLLYERIAKAFAIIRQGEDEVNSAASLEGGTISIGATITALDEFLFSFLERFREEHPSVKLRISTQSSDQTIQKLRSGSIEIAFVTTPFHSYEELEEVNLRHFENIFICGSEFPELRKGVHSIQELAQYPMVYLSSTMQLREYSDDLFASEGINVTPSIEADNANMIGPLVAKNLGIGLVPESLVKEELARGEVFRIDLDAPLPKRKVVMLRNKDFPSSPAASRFFLLAKGIQK